MNGDDVRKRRDEYQSALAEASGVSPQNAADQPKEGGTVDVDYYDNLKNESYKALLSKEVQASVAADQARKYTANALSAAGYGTQGLSESTSLGIGNTRAAALREAQNEYHNDILNINQQQRAEELQNANNDFETISALMSGATSQDQLDNIWNTYKSEIGSFDEKTQKQLNILYSMYGESLGGNGELGGVVEFTDKNDHNGYAYNDETGNLVKKPDQFRKELENLRNKAYVGEFKNGDYIRVKNTSGYSMYLYYNNGQFYYVTKSNYDKQNKDKKHEIGQ